MKKVLIGFERSQRSCYAFSQYTDEAYSCDLVDGSGLVPGHHLKMDFFEAVRLKDWDLIIAHPPCTYLSQIQYGNIFCKGGVVRDKERYQKMDDARKLFFDVLTVDCPHLCVENPVPVPGILPAPDQMLNYCWFGTPYSKRELLWLRNLPPLFATDITHSPTRFDFALNSDRTERELTPVGFASAMADQWYPFL